MGNRVETQIVPLKDLLSPTVALVLAALAYGLCLTAPFTFDDFAIFSAQPVTRPLTWLTFRLNGSSPALFHAVNLLLHLVAVWLCSDVLRRILPPTAAAIATLIFALHPIQSEAVDYIWARSTLLMTVFCLLSMRDWLGGNVWRAVFWLAVALAAKEEAVAMPVVFLLLHFSTSKDRRELRPIAAMFAIAVAAGAWTLFAANTTAGSQAGAQSLYTPLQYLSAEGLAILRYFQLVILPYGFTVDPTVPTGWWIAWLGVVALAGLAITRFTGARAGFWILAALVLLLPTSSIFPANDLAADRRVYLPMFAIAAALGLVIPVRAAVPLALALAALTAHRTWIWSDNTRLWSEAVERSPGKLRPRIQLARALPPNEAIPVLNDAKKIAPDDPLVASELGRMYLTLRQPAEALQEFGRALALEPSSPSALSNRGVALAMLKQDDAARADFQRALAIDPCSFEARLNLKRLGTETTTPPNCRYTPGQADALR